MLIPLKLSAQTDEQLMRRASRGNERAFEELYNRHARRLQGFFTRRLGDAELAADFMHDTFLRLYAARERY
jgi:RNA polymerase sigma-70 factor (ECF subfamily)